MISPKQNEPNISDADRVTSATGQLINFVHPGHEARKKVWDCLEACVVVAPGIKSG